MTHPPQATTLRIGVTGARAICPKHQARLEQQTATLLDSIANQARTRHATTLRLLSPLAEGADRLVAAAALAQNYALTVPMPFRRAHYEQTFPTTIPEFQDLLDQAAATLELDGNLTTDPGHAYEAVGRLVVRNTDIIVAIWDGLPGKRGGAAETIRYAANFGPPVICLHATDATAPPRWIEDAHDIRPGPERKPKPVGHHLQIYLDRLLLPPRTHPQHGHSLLHKIGHLARKAWHRFVRPARTPLQIFADEQPRKVPAVLRLHGWLMATMGGNPPYTGPRPPTDPDARRWYERYLHPDGRAGEYAKRHRSAYVWGFFLAATALSFAGISLGLAQWHGPKLLATTAEFLALMLLMGLVVMETMAEWQRRAIDYRLLAELCRKQQALAPLGWAVPRAGAWCTTAPAPDPIDPAHPDPAHTGPSWVAWMFSAWLRETPLVAGVMDPDRIEHARKVALNDLLDEQIAYHKTRHAQYTRAGKMMIRIADISFLLVVAIVAAKLMLLTSHAYHEPWADFTLLGFGIFGAILPAVSAAFFGIRAYADLEMLAEQSETMHAAFTNAKVQIEQLDLTAPLASQALGSDLAAVATLMLEDVQGWARLARVKIVEV